MKSSMRFILSVTLGNMIGICLSYPKTATLGNMIFTAVMITTALVLSFLDDYYKKTNP